VVDSTGAGGPLEPPKDGDVSTIELAGQYDEHVRDGRIHPHDAKSVDAGALEELKRLDVATRSLLSRDRAGFPLQFSKQPEHRHVFEAHLEIRQGVELPVIVAFAEAPSRRRWRSGPQRRRPESVVFHCSAARRGGQARPGARLLRLIHRCRDIQECREVREAAKVVPWIGSWLETDFPYMSPEPVRNQKPNGRP